MGVLAAAEPCRFCHDPAWFADEDGPYHTCCREIMGKDGLPRCNACITSKALARKWGREHPKEPKERWCWWE